MIGLTVHDSATPALRLRIQQLAPSGRRQLLALVSRALAREVKDHFRKREAGSPNRQGFPRTHFWRREGYDKTAVTSVTADQAVIAIGSPAIGHKLTGGTIRPGPGKKFLAIPLTAIAYGRRPSERHIPGLFFRRSRGRAWLATRDGGALRIHYLLVRSVTQRADPDTIPDRAHLESVVRSRVAGWFAARPTKQA